jgi:adenylate cyclase
MRGSAWISRPQSAETLEEGQRAFERALEIDPRSVEARIGLARVLVDRISSGGSNSPQQDGARGEQLLLEALERDANSSLGHNAMGLLRMTQNGLAEARIEFERTTTLDRNNSTAFRRLGYTTMFLGQPETAIPLFEKAIRLNPYSPDIAFTYFGLGGARLLIGQVDEGIDLLKKSRAANPRIFLVALWLAGALGVRGDLDEASAAVTEAAKLKPEVNSLAGIRSQFPWIWGNPQYLALSEKTWMAGLRRAGFPEE